MAPGAHDRPPLAYWLLPSVTALLRMQPYQASLTLVPPPGAFALPMGYMPKDTLTYLSFIRQAAASGSPFFYDQFTTDPHAPRFVLVLYWVLGLVSRVTGASPTTVLELSRVPLLFLFFAVLWGFLRPILPDRRTRLVASLLIGLSGGVDWLARPLLGLLPGRAALQATVDTQAAFGWSTFAGMFNPLWIAGSTLMLVCLAPILDPSGPTRPRDAAALALGLPLLFLVHPYSAVVVLAVAVALPLVEVVLARRFAARREARVWLALAPGCGLVLLLARWQAQDPVFRATSGNTLGPALISPFWYPLTLGAVLLLALRGAQIWLRDRHPYRFALLAWIATVAWLHSSPVLNGYHFVPYLHLPLCIVAASAVDEAWALRRSFRVREWALAGVLALALFGSPLAMTSDAIKDVTHANLFPVSYREVLADLEHRPAGNALVPPRLGNLLPAYTPHRVWAGHWFMTPGEAQRAAQYEEWTSNPDHAAELRDLVARQSIAYVVVPAARGDAVARELGAAVAERTRHGAVDLLVLRPGSARRGGTELATAAR